MALSTKPYKGARDFYPEDKRLQKYMFGVMRNVVEKFGYEEYDAPILEPTELFASKTSDEIVNEQTYTFTDRGERSVTIRTEMTPSVSRMVAGRRQELAYPVRWYSIPNLWRYERPQRGRLREFWQLNIDIFGVSGIEADHETILVADSILQAFGATRDMYVVKISSRQLVNTFLFDTLRFDELQTSALIRLIDRMNKMDENKFSEAIDEIIGDEPKATETKQKLFGFLQAKTIDDLPEELRMHDSLQELRRLLKLLDKSGLTNVQFDPTLMRGFDYYTDIVFEVFDLDPENNRAMFGGGRYDALVGLFGVDPVPTVGFGMGDVTLQNFLESHQLMPKPRTEVDLHVVLVGDVYAAAQEILAKLREANLRVSVDTTGRSTDKQIKSAVKAGASQVLFIGEQEIETGQLTVKNLESGTEQKYTVEQLVAELKPKPHA